jgi:hypothetical protein
MCFARAAKCYLTDGNRIAKIEFREDELFLFGEKLVAMKATSSLTLCHASDYLVREM